MVIHTTWDRDQKQDQDQNKHQLVLMHYTQIFILSSGSKIFVRWGCQPSRGSPTYNFVKFSSNLREIETIWTLGVGGRVKFYYVDLPLTPVQGRDRDLDLLISIVLALLYQSPVPVP